MDDFISIMVYCGNAVHDIVPKKRLKTNILLLVNAVKRCMYTAALAVL